jgi:sporulation protein YlmC with PRC-barrel domain
VKKGLQIVGMPVMGIKEGVRCGISKGFAIDAQTKKISAMVLIGDKNEYDLRLLRMSDVMNIGKDFIITRSVENARDIGHAGDLILLFGIKCVSSMGDVIGNVKDFTFNESTGEIQTLQIDTGAEVEGKEILTIANDLMFLSSDIVFEEEKGEDSSSSLSAYEREQREYLLGKTVGSDILDADGRVLIRKGTQITESIIEAAEKAQLLTDLTLSVE